MLLIYVIFSAFGLVGRGTVAACAVGTIILAVRMHLEYVRRVWFWGVIVAMAIVDAFLVAYVPFPNKNYTFPLVAPFGYLEYLLISACLRLAIKQSKGPDGSPKSDSRS